MNVNANANVNALDGLFRARHNWGTAISDERMNERIEEGLLGEQIFETAAVDEKAKTIFSPVLLATPRQSDQKLL
jgi:hypothetical protein